jgi:hypothetical protein
MLGACICSKTQWYGINAKGTCQQCSTMTPSTMYLACVLCRAPFYFDGYICTQGSNIPNMATSTTITACPTNYVARANPITNQTNQCVCSIAIGYYTSGTSCLSCTTQPIAGIIPASCIACSVTFGFYNTSQ